MVDWEEIWEDSDLKRGVIIIVVGLIIIASSTFLLNDYFKAGRFEKQLQDGITAIDSFYNTFAPPEQKKMMELDKEIQKLNQELESNPRKLLLTSGEGDGVLDSAKIQNDIRQIAQDAGIKLDEIKESYQDIKGFVTIQPFEIVFEGAPASISRFIMRLKDIDVVHKLESKPFSPQGLTSITLVVYSFDLDSWQQSEGCDITWVPPVIDLPDVSSIKVFNKDNLISMKNKITEDLKKIQGLEKKKDDFCELTLKRDLLKQKLDIIKEYSPQE